MRSANRLTLREAMIHASEMGRNEGWPRCYYWSGVWWRLHSKESKNPSEAIAFSRNQLRLYRDILSRPNHYQKIHPSDHLSDWLESALANKSVGPAERVRHKVEIRSPRRE